VPSLPPHGSDRVDKTGKKKNRTGAGRALSLFWKRMALRAGLGNEGGWGNLCGSGAASLWRGDPKMENYSKHFQKALSHGIDIGMKPPFILCAVSPKGSVLAMRFNEGHDPDPLAEHFENDTSTTPLHIMVVDRDGKAVRAVINRGEISYH
jgi:hypothetical protein